MRLSAVIFTIVLVATSATAAIAEAKEPSRSELKLMHQAKINESKAREIALSAVPQGTIKSHELEEENGLLVWSFDLTTPVTPNITEVQVNAKTGAVVSIQEESPEDQKNEAALDKAKNKKGQETKAN
ncbi:MAG: PepSY domain-containing protein [Lacunisphaera sp.]